MITIDDETMSTPDDETIRTLHVDPEDRSAWWWTPGGLPARCELDPQTGVFIRLPDATPAQVAAYADRLDRQAAALRAEADAMESGARELRQYLAEGGARLLIAE